MEQLTDYYSRYQDWLVNFRGEPVRLWMADHLELPVICVFFYMVLVLWIPDNFMKNRPAYNLRFLNIIWNLILSVFSMLGAYHTVPMIYTICLGPAYEIEYEFQPGEIEQRSGSLHQGLCEWNGNIFFNGHVGAYVTMFILSKIPEMIDTAFLVFQKKPVIFLHWYHHITVMLFCWHAYVYRIGTGLLFAAMNYGVHSIMYSYYLMCALGCRKLVRPFAIYITLLQIFQMVVGLLAEFYSIYGFYVDKRGCAANPTNLRLGTIMYLSYFMLFSKMFYDNYVLKRDRAAAAAVVAEKDHPAAAARLGAVPNSHGTNGADGKKRK